MQRSNSNTMHTLQLGTARVPALAVPGIDAASLPSIHISCRRASPFQQLRSPPLPFSLSLSFQFPPLLLLVMIYTLLLVSAALAGIVQAAPAPWQHPSLGPSNAKCVRSTYTVSADSKNVKFKDVTASEDESDETFVVALQQRCSVRACGSPIGR
jgi:hypothetical protein